MTEKLPRLRRIWNWLKAPLFLGIPIGILLLILAGGGFQGAMVVSNTNTFCFSCHLKMDTIVQEYKASPHYINENDVKATCAQCHVPHNFIDKMKVKVAATADIYYMLTGRITKENFESHRPRLAQKVWDHMMADDSEACRHCHTGANFDLTKQTQRARLNHQAMAEEGKSCIECHTGLAHKRVVVK